MTTFHIKLCCWGVNKKCGWKILSCIRHTVLFRSLKEQHISQEWDWQGCKHTSAQSVLSNLATFFLRNHKPHKYIWHPYSHTFSICDAFFMSLSTETWKLKNLTPFVNKKIRNLKMFKSKLKNVCRAHCYCPHNSYCLYYFLIVFYVGWYMSSMSTVLLTLPTPFPSSTFFVVLISQTLPYCTPCTYLLYISRTCLIRGKNALDSQLLLEDYQYYHTQNTVFPL